MDGLSLQDLSPQSLVREGGKLLLTARPTVWSTDPLLSSDRLMVFDLATTGLVPTYNKPTNVNYLRIMATKGNRAFVNLQGDGILILDIANPAAPIGTHFLRTLGYATHLESFDEDVFVASGYFGLNHLSTLDPPNLSAL